MCNSNKRKAEKLGMPYGTARHKLVKSLLWDFVCKAQQNKCFQCGTEILTIHDLSIEHKTFWETSDNPIELYFDIDNIAYSHLTCNMKAGSFKGGPSCGTETKYKQGCRCALCVDSRAEMKKKYYTSEKRREKYFRTGT